MSTRITINIGFYFEKEHYAQLQAFIPRSEAKNIPELRLEENKLQESRPDPITPKPAKGVIGANKKESEDENSEGDDEDNNIPNDMEI